jgi:hypothetical protein
MNQAKNGPVRFFLFQKTKKLWGIYSIKNLIINSLLFLFHQMNKAKVKQWNGFSSC